MGTTQKLVRTTWDETQRPFGKRLRDWARTSWYLHDYVPRKKYLVADVQKTELTYLEVKWEIRGSLERKLNCWQKHLISVQRRTTQDALNMLTYLTWNIASNIQFFYTIPKPETRLNSQTRPISQSHHGPFYFQIHFRSHFPSKMEAPPVHLRQK